MLPHYCESRSGPTPLVCPAWPLHQRRELPQDLSHRPHKLNTHLSPAREAIVVQLRRLLLLPLDDLLVITREFLSADISRSALGRCLNRDGVGNLRALQLELNPPLEGEPVARKAFKDDEPGFVHIDIKYLPQMPDESERSHLFVAIDRATRWVHIGIDADQTEASAVHFLEQLHLASPMKIVKLLTDNDAQFTDRFTSQARAPTGRHTFDVRCITSHPFRPSKPGGPSRLTSSRNRFMISRVLTVSRAQEGVSATRPCWLT